MDGKFVRKTSAVLTLIIVLLYVITGYGITQYQIVEEITFGILSKPLSFEIHNVLIFPLVVFLGIHLFFSCGLLKKRENEKNGEAMEK